MSTTPNTTTDLRPTTHTTTSPTEAQPEPHVMLDSSRGRSILSTRARLACAMAAGPVFLVSSVIQGSARSGFDFSRNAFSQLSLGDLGWIQIATFLMTGALTIAGASGIASALRSTRNGRRIAQLIAVLGASFLAACLFTADPGEGFPSGAPQDAGTLSTHGLVHLASASIGFLALCAAFVLLGRHFHRHGRVAWALPCYVVPALTVAGISASATTIVAFTVGAGSAILWLTAVSSRLRSDLTDHLS